MYRTAQLRHAQGFRTRSQMPCRASLFLSRSPSLQHLRPCLAASIWSEVSGYGHNLARAAVGEQSARHLCAKPAAVAS
eukprot:5944998-Alexandrium_andersonii.AAC.1